MRFEQRESSIETKIAEARSFEELYEVLVSEPSITSLQGTSHSTEMLVSEIELIRERVEAIPNRDNIEDIPFLNLLTMTGGLRSKVAELLKKEKPVQSDELAPEQPGENITPPAEIPDDGFRESAKLVPPLVSEIEIPTFIHGAEQKPPQVDADKIKAGGAMEMPALKSDKEDEKKIVSKPSFVKKYVNAIKAGIKVAKEDYGERVSERKRDAADKKREAQIEKEAKRIEKEKGKEAADEFRRLRGGGVMFMEAGDENKSKPKKIKGNSFLAQAAREAQEREKKLKTPEGRWELMSPEERLEKYGKTFEIRERLMRFKQERARLAVLENDVNTFKSFGDRLLRRVLFEGDEHPKKMTAYYEEALKAYEESRAEYIGAKTWRMLKERQRVAETQSERFEGGVFEKLKKGWQWLGDQNAEKLINSWHESGYVGADKAYFAIKSNRFVKLAARMMSLRTLASLGLLGGGMAIGFGSSIGIGLVAARRVMGGTSAAFGSYDLMKFANEKTATALSDKKIEKMSMPELEEKMAEFEARSKFNGGRTVNNKEYLLLRKAYLRKEVDEAESVLDVDKLQGDDKEKARKEAYEAVIKGKFRTKSDIASKLQLLDAFLRTQGAQLSKEEKHRKILAVGVGLFAVGAYSASDIAKFMYGKTEFAGLTPAEIKSLIHKGPIVPVDMVRDSVSTEGAVPAAVADSASQEVVAGNIPPADPTGEALEKLSKEIPKVKIMGEVPTLKEIAVAGAEKHEELVGTVKQGGRISQAVWDMVRAGKITSKELAVAWKSAASMVTLESGTKVHISELGLSHTGDQVVYVAEKAGVPAHFEVVDFARDKFHVGNNADLANALKAEGRPIPRWLQEALGMKTQSGVGAPAAVVGERTPEQLAKLADFARQLKAEGKPIPESLLNALGTEGHAIAQGGDVFYGPPEDPLDKLSRLEVPEIKKPLTQLPPLKMQELSASAAETLRKAGLGLLEVSPEEVRFSWGTAEFILDKEDGHIVDVFIMETVSVELRPVLVEKAVKELLNPNYMDVLQQNLPEVPEDFKIEDLAPSENPEFVLAERVAIAEQSAWEVFRLKQVIGAMKNLTPSESFALNNKVNLLIKAKETLLDVKIFKRP